MPKIAKILAFAVPLLVIVILTAAISYQWGVHQTEELILHGPRTNNVSTSPPPDYDKSIATLRDQLNRLTNDYESACYNYQTLYTAYDALYAQAGADSRQDKVVRPDGAHGNEVSCYR